MIPGMTGPVSVVALPNATITYTDSVKDETSLTTYTYSSRSIGAAAPGRIIIIGVGGIQTPSGQTISSVTVGGNPATAQTSNVSNGNWPAAKLYSIQVDTGTTANIVVTYSGGMIASHIGIWAAYGLTSPTATATLTNVAAAPTGSINVQAGGVLVGWCDDFNGSGTPTFTWAGPTENYELPGVTYSSTGSSGASAAYGTAQTGLTVTCTPTGSTPSGGLAAAAFR